MKLIDLDELKNSLHTTKMSEYFGTVTSEEIGEWLEAQPIVAQWNKLIFTRNSDVEYTNSGILYTVENLPEYNKPVLVTNGKSVWTDAFDDDGDGLWLSGTDNDLDDVIAWMELPEPYKE